MNDVWPPLPFAEWKATCKTLHMWTQIIGKIRLSLTPWINHSWHVTLYVSARGLSTGLIAARAGSFDMEFDFVDHLLRIRSSDGAAREIPLEAQSVSLFYAAVRSSLSDLG